MIFFSILIVPNSLWASVDELDNYESGSTICESGSTYESSEKNPQLTPVKDQLESYQKRIENQWNYLDNLGNFLRSPQVTPDTSSEKINQKMYQKYIQDNLEEIQNTRNYYYQVHLYGKLFLELQTQGVISYKYLDKNDEEIDLKNFFLERCQLLFA